MELHRALGQVFETIGRDRANELLILTGTEGQWLLQVDAGSFDATHIAKRPWRKALTEDFEMHFAHEMFQAYVNRRPPGAPTGDR